MKLLIALITLSLMGCNPCYAGQLELDKETARMATKGHSLTAKEISDLETKGWRTRRSGELPVSNTARPSDYVDDVKRGTIEFRSDWFNYSRHKVKIPDGTIMQPNEVGRRYNFSQMVPGTDCIDRSTGFGHNLTFIKCNLVNVKTYDDWTIEASNQSQIDRVGEFDGEGAFVETDAVKTADTFKTLRADRVKPVGAIE